MTLEEKKWLRFRIASLLGLFLIMYLALITRAYQIQVQNGPDLKARAAKQHTTTLRVESERGVIFDRNGEKLAISVMADSVCADPSKIEDIPQAAKKLAAILGVDKGVLLKRMSGAKNFCWLARKITPEQSDLVEKLDLDGIFIVKEPKRFYPNGELAGHLIGFVGTDANGLEGLEFRFDNYLKGEPERLIWTRDARGKRLYPRVETVAAQKKDGANLVLTIDSRIQYLVETQLKEAVQSKSAKGGMAVVMDPKTGEILALANEKSFDPNEVSKIGANQGKNRVITDSFDPGSTFKPFLGAAALEEGLFKETDRIYCENGNYVIADRVIREAQRKKHGYLSFAEVIKYSSNIGSVKMGERLGKEKFYSYIQRFGFGQKTGIDLPGEAAGLLRPARNWTRVDAATIAFGQGISVTGIQLVTALSAIANQGVLMKPYIVRGLVDNQGQIIQKYDPTPVRQVISPQAAKRMAALMGNVVSAPDGTGKNARIDNVSVAGKTGTSQKFDFARNVYSSDRVRTSFMGFFPIEDPQVVILVILDEPQIDKWGGVAAAPVFRKIGEQILTCFKTHIRENPVPEEINKNPKIRQITAQATIEQQRQDPDDDVMPDFRGLTMRQALKTAKQRGIELQIAGNGWAIAQVPAPGVVIGDNRYCKVNFSAGQ